MTINYAELGARAATGTSISPEDALAVLNAPDCDTLEIVNAASKPRFAFFSNRVKVNFLVNLKSGLCPEDCFYCSQRLGSKADILKYSWISPEKALEAAEAGINAGARRVCLVASGTGPSNRDVDRIANITKTIKDKHPQVEICACAGFLKDEQGDRLADAGVDAYNHNVNSPESHYEKICTTHTYGDRIHTVNQSKQAKLSPCSGFIAGMGESPEQLVELAFALRDLDVDSIPVNFLIPFDGTPLKGNDVLTANQCLRILSMVRLVNPSTEVRVSAGREIHFRHMQALSLYVANSLFLGDYLTSEGQAGNEDINMIYEAGFVVERIEDVNNPVSEQPVRTVNKSDEVISRKRGVGTELPANV